MQRKEDVAVAVFLVHGLEDQFWVFIEAFLIATFDHQGFVFQRFAKGQLAGGPI